MGERDIRVESLRALGSLSAKPALQVVVELLVLRVGAIGNTRRHLPGSDTIPRPDRKRLCDRAAVTTVRQHDDPHATAKLRQQAVELIVDQLAVVEAPGFVVLV